MAEKEQRADNLKDVEAALDYLHRINPEIDFDKLAREVFDEIDAQEKALDQVSERIRAEMDEREMKLGPEAQAVVLKSLSPDELFRLLAEAYSPQKTQIKSLAEPSSSV